MEQGALKLRAFPITEESLDQLGTVYRDFAILVAVAGALAGFGIDVVKDIVIATDLTGLRLGVSLALGLCSLGAALFVGFAAWTKWRERGAKIGEIKRNVIWSKSD